jgi:hypothetical protein
LRQILALLGGKLILISMFLINNCRIQNSYGGVLNDRILQWKVIAQATLKGGDSWLDFAFEPKVWR